MPMNSDKAKLTPHPAAEAFPLMASVEFARLKEDIAKNRLLEPRVVCDGLLLDGRHRYRACLELGMEPEISEYSGPDPLGFVISKNLHRRQLNPSQRALVAAQVADLKQGGARGKPQICGLTHAQAASKFSVSKRQVEKASALLNAVESGRAIGELVEVIRRADRRLDQVAKISALPKEEQRKVLAAPSPGRSRTSGDLQEWYRELDQITLEMIRIKTRCVRLVAQAEAAGELSTNQWKRLVDSCRSGADWFSKVGQEIERYKMEFEDL
jgi:hypothetical protein